MKFTSNLDEVFLKMRTKHLVGKSFDMRFMASLEKMWNNKKGTGYFFNKNSPKLYVVCIWRQAKSTLPEISDRVKKVVFVDEEEFTLH